MQTASVAKDRGNSAGAWGAAWGLLACAHQRFVIRLKGAKYTCLGIAHDLRSPLGKILFDLLQPYFGPLLDTYLWQSPGDIAKQLQRGYKIEQIPLGETRPMLT